MTEKKYSPELTLEERREIEKYVGLGYSNASIAKILKRGKNTISTEIRNKSFEGVYYAEKAHEETLRRRQIKSKNARNNGREHYKNLKTNTSMNIYKRVKQMENQIMGIIAQLEVIFELIEKK